MPPKRRHLLSSLLVLVPLLLALDADALVLGEIRSSSRLGELLHAEIDVQEEAADRFDASCVKLYRPAQASADLPWITEGRLSFRHENGSGKLYISSDQPLRDPVVQIGIRSSCAGGRVWRDYTFLVSPDLPAPQAAPLAPVAAFARPATVVSTTKNLRSSSSASSTPETAASPAAGGATLRLSTSDSAHPARRIPDGAMFFDSILPLRMSSELRSTGPASEFARDLLRLEYRMLAKLYEQAGDQLAVAERLRQLEGSAGELMAASLRLGAAGGSAPATAPSPDAAVHVSNNPGVVAATPASVLLVATIEPALARAIPKAGPQAPTLEPGAPDHQLLYVGLAAALLFFLIIVIRRRRVDALAEQFLPMHAPTIIVEPPEFSQPPGRTLAMQVEDAAATSLPSLQQPPVAQDLPPPPESLGVDPVMELAEIMLSFGRVNGAAQTLQEFIEANPKAALQPWIRLLEIYRDSGMRADFEALATNLNQNFNVEVVHWDNALPGERVEMSLELLPHIRDQIDALWGKPECYDYLQQLLRDNRDGQRTGFSLPVVKEILLLIDLMVAEMAATK